MPPNSTLRNKGICPRSNCTYTPETNITHTIDHIEHEISSPDKIERRTNSMRLAGKASVPAGGPFIVLLPADGPLIFSPLVHMTFVPAAMEFSFSIQRHSWRFVAGSVTATVLQCNS